MMSGAAFMIFAALALTVLTHAQPLTGGSAPSSSSSSSSSSSPAAHPLKLQKRTATKGPTSEELAIIKGLILNQVASELGENYLQQQVAQRILAKEEQKREKEVQEEEEEEEEKEQEMIAEAKAKRMFVPLSGLPGELPTIKRQIRYHQCYFNPISCFRRK